MSFGRRLALFFGLIAGVPALVLVLVLVFVGESAQRGKADARLAAGIRTATALYGQDVNRARGTATQLASQDELMGALRAGDRATLVALVRSNAQGPVTAVRLTDSGVRPIASAGSPDAVAFATIALTNEGQRLGSLQLSTTTAGAFLDQLRALTGREALLTRGGSSLAATIAAPAPSIAADGTQDVKLGGTEYRAHALALGGGLNLILLGPRDGGIGTVGTVTLLLLTLFLAGALLLAWLLARRLTRLHDRVAAQAVTDPLTGLFNRRFLAETLEREVDRALRFGHPISLIILDVDDFKQINDRYGHLRGDDVLERVAEAMRSATRSIDVPARYGGDEMAMILPETDRSGAAVVAERIRDSVPGSGAGSANEPEVTISAGVATIPGQATDMTSLIGAADGALLRAKRAGKNMIRTAPRATRFQPDAPSEPDRITPSSRTG